MLPQPQTRLQSIFLFHLPEKAIKEPGEMFTSLATAHSVTVCDT
jgi:hypothetical protein